MGPSSLNGIMDAAFILPPSHIGSPQNMFQFCQDSDAVAVALGPSQTSFVTATANPQWENIQVALLPGQMWSDCPDIVTCVFHLSDETVMTADGCPTYH